jgi:hypothetical protein
MMMMMMTMVLVAHGSEMLHSRIAVVLLELFAVVKELTLPSDGWPLTMAKTGMAILPMVFDASTADPYTRRRGCRQPWCVSVTGRR